MSVAIGMSLPKAAWTGGPTLVEIILDFSSPCFRFLVLVQPYWLVVSLALSSHNPAASPPIHLTSFSPPPASFFILPVNLFNKKGISKIHI